MSIERIFHCDWDVQGNCTGPQLLNENQDSNVMWYGEPEAINRLLMGFGTGLPNVMHQQLGVPEDQIIPAIEIIKSKLVEKLVTPGMPIQDAIDLAEFLVDLTIKYSRFKPGAPTVGGAIEVAAITKHEGFKWVRRKHYYDSEYNPS